ncbi:putative retrotransposon hot spot protein (RHS) [Trypanosoma cruzi]|uniref:Putative retrotransposon hot spot protein (RHS) n=1 Tax=Trypanosoma cruzi TaxID=5693 RepID=A0A2V2XCF6_TRYCR|nr:putative retrotransposon hot spot protein (RHS) [Trypanosoma cruzi]
MRVEPCGGTPDSEKTKTGTGMKVEEGKPKQSWTYKAVGVTLEKDDGVQQSGAPRPRLMVLTSDKAWPCSWKESKFTRDCHVNCEVERVWQIVKGDLTEWFSPHGETYFTPGRRVLIGTPGLGIRWLPARTFSTGCCTTMPRNSKWSRTFLVEVRRKCLAIPRQGDKNMCSKTSKNVLYDLWDCGMKGYITYNVTKKGTPPETFLLLFIAWGMIVVHPQTGQL